MSYVASILRPGEQVIATGKLHWIVYDRSCFCLLMAGIAFIGGNVFPDMKEILQVIGAIFIILAVIAAVKAWFQQWITEIAVTDRRVIYKTGFIRRRTAEMNMDKVESVTIDQSIPGRILGYGTIHISGTGQGIEHLHRVRSPMMLRSSITAK